LTLRTDKQAIKQADNLCLQDSSLREREYRLTGLLALNEEEKKMFPKQICPN